MRQLSEYITNNRLVSLIFQFGWWSHWWVRAVQWDNKDISKTSCETSPHIWAACTLLAQRWINIDQMPFTLAQHLTIFDLVHLVLYLYRSTNYRIMQWKQNCLTIISRRLQFLSQNLICCFSSSGNNHYG